MNTDNNPTPPDVLPSSLVSELSDLNDEGLRATLDYGQALLNARIEPVSRIEAGPNEEIVSIEDHGTHTAVIKRHDCADGCNECPHGPYLYHVRSEKQVTGEEELHWTYVGEVNETCTS